MRSDSMTSMMAGSVTRIGHTPIALLLCRSERLSGYPQTVRTVVTGRWHALLVVLILLAGCAKTVSPATLPPAGSIWFGTSFDPSTMALSGQETSVGATQAFSMVAHLTKSMSASDLAIRVYWNGGLVSTQPVSGSTSGDVWGFSPGPLFQAGTWRYDITDVGGNVLASGTLTAT